MSLGMSILFSFTYILSSAISFILPFTISTLITTIYNVHYTTSDAQITRQTPFVDEIKRLTSAVQSKAVSLNLSRWDDILYPNYALSDTPLELMYGENLPRLRKIASKYDPGRVMSLTGGFRFV